MNEKEKALCNKYGLKNVKIAIRNEYETSDEAVGRETARFLSKIIKNDDIIGVSWGQKLIQVVNYVTPKNLSGVKVVQFKACLTYTEQDIYDLKMI